MSKHGSETDLIIGYESDFKPPVLTEVQPQAVILPVDTFVDYYELLHVQPSAPAAVIKASYRAMLQKLNHHPDKGGDVGFAQLLNAAATTLCNAESRAHYDQLRQQQLAKASDAKTERDNRTNTWGEPGGSPTGVRQSDGARHETGDTAKGFHEAADPETTYLNTTLPSPPAKPHCPFCLSTYSPDQASISSTTGYTNSNRCQTCNAARTPIAQVPLSNNDQLRRIHRHQHATPAKLWPSWPTPAPAESVLTDFSPVGCALEYQYALAGSDVIMLETALFNAVCKVRHCKSADNGQFAIGLEFITLDMLARPGTLLEASA